MLRTLVAGWIASAGLLALADGIPLVEYRSLEIPITPFSNMASGYQATNPGFRAIIRSDGGEFLAGGHMTMDVVMRGTPDDASQGSAYGKLILKVDIEESYPGISQGIMQGNYHGNLSICMASDPNSTLRNTECKDLKGNIHPERPFQWLNKPIEFSVNQGDIRITKYHGYTGEGGTSSQLSLAVFHPAFGFAAPGKAFKDYQSPLVLDLDHNGSLDLINVWDTKIAVQFDLNGLGEKVRTGWVKPQDGLLFWDNGTGCVQNGSQLFGEFTNTKKGEKTFENGFEALRSVTRSQTNTIRVADFPNLKVWKNTSQDGVCKSSEVTAASKVAKEISLDFRKIENPPLNADNEVRLIGHYVGRDGKKYPLGDVWFKQRRNLVSQK